MLSHQGPPRIVASMERHLSVTAHIKDLEHCDRNVINGTVFVPGHVVGTLPTHSLWAEKEQPESSR